MDIRTRRLPSRVLLLGFPLAVAGRIILGNIPAALVIAGGASGALFVIVSRMTEEAFGTGTVSDHDNRIFLGIWDLLAMLVTAFFSGSGFFRDHAVTKDIYEEIFHSICSISCRRISWRSGDRSLWMKRRKRSEEVLS